MSISQFPENYLQSLSVVRHTALIDEARVAITKSGASKKDRASKQRLLEIERLLSKARQLRSSGDHRGAISALLTARSRIHQLLQPEVSIDFGVQRGRALRLAPQAFDALLSASLQLIDQFEVGIQSAAPSPAVRIPNRLVVGWTAEGEQGGVELDNGLPAAVQKAAQAATQHIASKDWAAAEASLRAGLEATGQQRSRGALKARATLALNLGGVLLQQGSAAEAAEQLTTAQAAYKRLGDTIGQAQAQANRAAAAQRLGQADQAATLLAGSRKLLDTQHEVRPAAPEATPSVAREVARLETGRSLAASRAAALLDSTRLASVASVLELSVAEAAVTSDVGELVDAARSRDVAVSFRDLSGGWLTQKLESTAQAAERLQDKRVSLHLFGEATQVRWKSGEMLPRDTVLERYRARVNEVDFTVLNRPPVRPEDLSAQLPHLYYYAVPVALGDAHHDLGDHAAAEDWYEIAADYAYINTTVEVPALWRKIAANVLAWGDNLYQNDELAEALAIYQKVMNPPSGNTPVNRDALLHRHSKLRGVGRQVERMLRRYEQDGVGDLNPLLAATVLEIRARLIQLDGGLDFLGLPTNFVPIWTFDYLQQAARYFAQQAARAEARYIDFRDRAEQERMTQLQLKQAVEVSAAEIELARRRQDAAQAHVDAYSEATTLAALRASNASQNRSNYSAMSWERLWWDEALAWYSGNSTKYKGGVTGVGGKVKANQESSRITRKRGELVRDYELASMNRQITELNQARVVAEERERAARAQRDAAAQLVTVAQTRNDHARQMLASFNNQLFDEQMWIMLSAHMLILRNSYLSMATTVARMMQQAYNFEHDATRNTVKSSYTAAGYNGFLGSEHLLRDIDSFTYDLITTSRAKRLPVKHTISLAERYPYHFATALRRTGRMSFETRLADFDEIWPGSYNRRIEAVEVEVVGLVPAGGVTGMLTNGGISRYRKGVWGDKKYRIQPSETLLLSEYRLGRDSIVFPPDARALRTFEGAGVASSWTLDLMPGSQDIEMGSIVDVRLTFYFHASYSRVMDPQARAWLAARPGHNQRSRSVPLRDLFPDGFFHFQDTGVFDIELLPIDFPEHHLQPTIRELSLLIIPELGASAQGWQPRLTVPGTAPVALGSTDAEGGVSAPGGSALLGGSAVGAYALELRAADHPARVVDGQLDLGSIRDVVLIMVYDFVRPGA